MEQRFRCISCNRDETWAGFFCPHCDYNWEEEAYVAADGTVRASPCPRCLKLTEAEHIRCNRTACMAVWPAPRA